MSIIGGHCILVPSIHFCRLNSGRCTVVPAETQKANFSPWRLDLDWRWLRRALELGCTFSINPDAHSTGEIASSTRWGLAIARKSGMPADRVVNAPDRDKFALWLASRTTRRRSLHRTPTRKRLEPA